jgi:hypothetical protein
VHPNDCEAVLPPLAAESKAFRIQAVHLSLAHSRRFSVAAGILPAVEPGRPARRRKRPRTPTVLENVRTALIFHRSFRAAGRQPSTADETSAATTPPPLFPEAYPTVPTLQLQLHPPAFLGGFLDGGEHAQGFQAVLKRR